MAPVATDHPALNGIDLDSSPPILGYNITRPRDGCEVLATWGSSPDPAIAVGQFGSGRVAAYTSDPAPHWGCNLVSWDRYQTLWLNLIAWLTAA